MAGNVRITMLGAPASGKTCYMLGMYNYMQIGLNGFTMSMDDLDESMRLEKMWFKLVEGGSEDRWPMLTGSRADYNLSFNYGFMPLLDFNWMDYRGGALMEESTDEDKQALMEALEESQCIFIAVSGENLKDELGKSNNMQRLLLKNINNMLTKVLRDKLSTSTHPFPLVILITKYDMCADRGRDAVLSDIRKFFTPAFAPDSNVITAVIPVSLGSELSEHPDTGSIEVMNMHLPIAFAVWSQFKESDALQQDRLKGARATLSEQEARRGLASLFRKSDIRHQLDTVRTLEAQADKIARTLSLLSNEMKGMYVYHGGEKVEL